MHCDYVYNSFAEHVLLQGKWRDTRSGRVLSSFGHFLEFDLREGLSILTSKFVSPRACVGELLWFMNGETTIETLKRRTFGDYNSDRKTIWCPDFARWKETEFYKSEYCEDMFGNHKEPTASHLGPIYGSQWFDQLGDIIERIKTNPNDRRLIVNSWNVSELDEMCLPPCHYSFQFYVDGDYIDLMWHQRS